MNRDDFEIKCKQTKGEQAVTLFLRCIVIPGLLAYAGWTYWRCREEADMLDDLEWRLYLDLPDSEKRNFFGLKITDSIKTDERIVSISPIYTLDWNALWCRRVAARQEQDLRDRGFPVDEWRREEEEREAQSGDCLAVRHMEHLGPERNMRGELGGKDR